MIRLMYAIAFDLDTDCLKKSYSQSYQNAYGAIEKFLAGKGFTKQQGSLYYGDAKVTMVGAVVAVTEMGKTFPWLKSCVSDIRILQLVAHDDLQPALDIGFEMAKEASEKTPKKITGKPRVIKE